MEISVKKHKFNAIDAIIIIVIAAVIGAAAFLLATGKVSVAADTVTIEYVIQFRTIRNEFADNFTVGDTVVDSVAKYRLGEVVSYTKGPAIATASDLTAGEIKAVEYPDHSTVEVTVSAEATIGADGRYILDGGYDISVGSTLYVRMPNYNGVGFCIQLRETEAK